MEKKIKIYIKDNEIVEVIGIPDDYEYEVIHEYEVIGENDEE